MIFENVNFNDEEVKKMSQDEFEARHVDLFWLDRDEPTRRKMLGQAYRLIVKPATTSKSKSSK